MHIVVEVTHCAKLHYNIWEHSPSAEAAETVQRIFPPAYLLTGADNGAAGEYIWGNIQALHRVQALDGLSPKMLATMTYNHPEPNSWRLSNNQTPDSLLGERQRLNPNFLKSTPVSG